MMRRWRLTLLLAPAFLAFSATELAAYGVARCDALRSGLSVRVDGIAVRLAVTDARAALAPGQAGLTTLRLECAYRAALGASRDGPSRLVEYADTNYAERI